MAQRVGTLHFWLDDDRDTVYNASTDLSFSVYMEDEFDDFIDINDLVDRCMIFAKALGFADKTVEQAFGREYE